MFTGIVEEMGVVRQIKKGRASAVLTISAKKVLEDRYNFVMQEITDPAHKCINGELINRAFDKGRGIIRVCEKLGVPVANSYSFGDSMNDLAAIQAAGYSVCMENGSETLKKYCDMVCPSVDDDGIAG